MTCSVHIHEGTDGAEHFVLVNVAEFVAVEPGGLARFDDVDGVAESDARDLAAKHADALLWL